MKDFLTLIGFGWRYARGYLIAMFSLAAFHQVVIFFEHVYSVKFIIDAIQFGRPFELVLTYIAVVAVAVCLVLIVGSWLDEYRKHVAVARVHQGIQRELFAQAARLDLADYDDPSRYDEFVRAVNEAPQRFDQALDRTKTLVSQVVMGLSTAVFVLLTDAWGFLFAAAGIGASVAVSLRQGKRQFARDTETLPERRRMAYFTRVFALADHAKELRLTPIASTLERGYDEAVARAAAATQRQSRPLAALNFWQSFVLTNFLFNGLFMSYLVVKALVTHSLGLGDLVALASAVSGLARLVQAALTGLPELSKDALYAASLRAFRQRRALVEVPAEPLPLPSGPWKLELKGVSFSYPAHGERAPVPVLHDVNLVLNADEKVAVVGHNGAGKTTLTKLLLRLYDPTEGRIELNGLDIRRFDPQAYRSLVSSVFQDFQIFAATVAENTVLDVVGPATDRPALEGALAKSGFGERLSTLGGLDTALTREFDDKGVNLSGGENQKIALARVFLRGTPSVLLDEPSSALDPESEYRLNQNLAEAAEGKSVLYISHRLSSTRMADRILLLEHGRVLEQGSHDELIAHGGRYAQMFRLQAERYRPPV